VPTPDIFLSYSREDQATARRFADAFEKAGFMVWWDQTLHTGEAYDHVTEQALRAARAVVVLWSQTSVASRWVRAEATIADRQKTLMPAMIEPCDRPVMFELTQTAELAHWKGDAKDPAWQAFVADLRRITEPGVDAQAPMPAPDTMAVARGTFRGRRAPLLLGVVAAVVVVAVAGFLFQRSAGAHRARTELIPEIARLVDAGDNARAFELATDARRSVPDDPLLTSLTPLFAATYAISSTPAGAEVHVRRYDGGDQDWQHVGRTPLPEVELPRTALRWRLEKAGFGTVEFANSAFGSQIDIGAGRTKSVGELHVELKSTDELPEDMVFVPAGPAVPAGEIQPVATVPGFFLQRTEVTNVQYKEFVAAGGYERRSFWQELEDQTSGKSAGLEAAMKQFVDSTGRPGPGTWELGGYTEGQADYPVTGISWYEAAAYARFRGRSLPTYFHWLRAAFPQDELPASLGASIAPASNFGAQKAAPVASYPGVGLYGTYDLFGNAREWLWNPGLGGGWLIGGSWEDPSYQFAYTSAETRMSRSRLNGFRTLLVSGEAREMAALWAEVDLRLNRANVSNFKPVPDAVYADYERQLAYQPGVLNASAEEVLADTEDWTKVRVTIDTGYNGERMALILFKPKRFKGPYQPVIFVSGGQIVMFPGRSEIIEPGFAGYALDYVVKSGRMLVQPVLKGTFDRFQAPYDPRDTVRDLQEWIARRQDLGRTLDYLATRQDVLADRTGYIGMSFGASAALPLLAVEHRFKAAVLVSGGMPPPLGPLTPRIPLMDVASHAARIRIPVLMINGRYDNTFPVKTAAEPLLRLLGTPSADKASEILEYGHGGPPRAETLRFTLGWFDKYLGEVRR
jgi:formylglycine-generating enzyme required for sulfatase activity/dienelactone hydrolase